METKIKTEIKRLRKVMREAARVAAADAKGGYYYNASNDYRRADTLRFAILILQGILKGD